jgi:hypothetical protein
MIKLLPPASDHEIPYYLAALGVPGITDLHVHFMPDRVQQKVWGFFDRLPEMGKTAWPIAYRFSEEKRVQILRSIDVVAFSTLNYAHRPGMAEVLNDYSRDFATRYDDVIRSATFFPEAGVEDQVERVLDEGAKIFKIHIQVGAFSPLDTQLDTTWRLIAQAGVPVVIHCGSGPHGGEFTGPQPVFELVERHPDLVLIVAHMGMPEYAEFAELACSAPNVYLDTTMVGTEYAVQEFGRFPEGHLETVAELSEKIVFGTDFPTIPYSYSHQIEALHNWGLGEDWMRKVLWHNPQRLLAGVHS